MNERNIEVLNDVTAKLIDSCKGYGMCADMVEKNPRLQREFSQRQKTRQSLVNEFQSQVRAYGGDYEVKGTVGGSMHQAYSKFMNLFKEDTQAAADALDTGEEHLANYISDQLEEQGLTYDTSNLLRKARANACEGERFADYLDD